MLWKSDIDHGLWELLSAAFNHIRDNHPEDSVTIDQFLAIATQVVPIVPADQYLKRRGWVRVGDALEHDDTSPQELPKITNFSCAGVARYCFRQGLISRAPKLEQASMKALGDVQASAQSISFASVASTSVSNLKLAIAGQKSRQQVPFSVSEGALQHLDAVIYSRDGGSEIDSGRSQQSPTVVQSDAIVTVHINDEPSALLASELAGQATVATRDENYLSKVLEVGPGNDLDTYIFAQNDIELFTR